MHEVVKAKADCLIIHDGGDVPYLVAAGRTGPHTQIVYASGGYDAWSVDDDNLNLAATNISLEQAVEIVVREYTP